MLEPLLISEALGGKRILGKDIKSGLELVELVHKGFPVEVAEYVVRENVLTKQEIFKYIVSSRTYDRRKKNHRLSVDESDKLARFIRVRACALMLLGKEEASKWLREPNPLLGNKTPFYYLDSDSGCQLIESLLGRLAHGIPS